ncbi:hypothetical protein Vafri_9931 [Volvox africanus]|uniref:WHIM1 domain-containing protein n=1 Tax=Volvox africanus TaxID=51714 RepID=A0A8J4F047_9CHLO|nr:hypothetical protein Vafri_9931 [Volvox africanus]
MARGRKTTQATQSEDQDGDSIDELKANSDSGDNDSGLHSNSWSSNTLASSMSAKASSRSSQESDDGVSQTSESDETPQLQTEEEATEALRSCWQFASVVQCARVFAKPLQLRPFSADQLESSILKPEESQGFLAELVFKLLRPDADAPYVECDAARQWEAMLHDKLHRQWRNYFPRNLLSRRGFMELTALQRVHLLYALCEWRAHECPAVREVIRSLADDSDTAGPLRQRPIGEDSRGRRYYFFSGTGFEDAFLFRETPPRATGKGGRDASAEADAAEWCTECTTLEEVQELSHRMGTSRNRNERALHAALEEILPKLTASMEARRKAEERAVLYESMPKKRSDRLHKLQQMKEEEDAAKKARTEEEKRKREEEAKERERRRKEKEKEERLKEMEDARRKFLGLAASPPAGPSREERMRLREERRGSEEPLRMRSASREHLGPKSAAGGTEVTGEERRGSLEAAGSGAARGTGGRGIDGAKQQQRDEKEADGRGQKTPEGGKLGAGGEALNGVRISRSGRLVRRPRGFDSDGDENQHAPRHRPIAQDNPPGASNDEGPRQGAIQRSPAQDPHRASKRIKTEPAGTATLGREVAAPLLPDVSTSEPPLGVPAAKPLLPELSAEPLPPGPSSVTLPPMSSSAELVSAEPVSAEPVSAEPVSAEPVSAGGVSAEPVSAEPVSAGGVSAEPVSAEPVSAGGVSAEPVSAEPVLAGGVSAEPVSAEPVLAEPVLAEPVLAGGVSAEPGPVAKRLLPVRKRSRYEHGEGWSPVGAAVARGVRTADFFRPRIKIGVLTQVRDGIYFEGKRKSAVV